MPSPLEGIRVIDWTIWQQGPVCSVMLADLGAEVIKIEDRINGDPGRSLTRAVGLDHDDRPNFYFEATNRNKRSLTLDLKNPQGREVLYALVAKSDVFVQNFRGGVARRLGVDYETLRKHNPKLIYASGSGYGAQGPEADEPSFDRLALARSGLMLAAGESGMPPCGIAEGIADQVGAITLSHGILSALVARERFGVGQEVHASLLGSMAWLQNLSLSSRLMMGAAIPRGDRKRATNPLWNHYQCGDDQWLAMGMLQADRYWPTFCEAIERGDMITDERFSTLQERARHSQECIAIIDLVFATKSRDQWLDILQKAGDLIVTAVNSVDDVPNDPQVVANGYVQDFEHPQFGDTQVIGHPVSLSETPAEVRHAAPEFGQHTEEVLQDVLGFSWEQIENLRNSEAI
ncbi:MAG: CoA transferase [Halieaceae bacterium]|jgi:CoA:oxalate CoA-transferase|nr:CoA transferase [Halieaceae bacterium]